MSMREDTCDRSVAPLRTFDFKAPLNGMVVTAGGMIAAGLGDGSVRLIRPDFESRAVWPHCEGAAILKVVVDLDGRSILTGGDDGRIARTDEDGRTIPIASFPGKQTDVLAVNPASGLRAVAAGREIHILDERSKIIASTGDHPSTVSGLAFDPEGGRLAASHYGGVTLWPVPTLGDNPVRLKWTGSHLGVSWSPDGSTVMTAMQENELHGWQVSDGANMRMKGYTNKVRSMAWTPEPVMLVTSGGESVIAWPFSDGGPTGKQPLELGTDSDVPVSCIAVHPKRPCVAAGFADGSLRLYAMVNDEVLHLQTGVRDQISELVWSMDGNRLAVGTAAGEVILFPVP
jgi:WD40 repeat protein